MTSVRTRLAVGALALLPCLLGAWQAAPLSAEERALASYIDAHNTEALALLNQRFVETMDEVKALIEKASAGERRGEG